LTAIANALAETVNGYYKAELIRGPARTGPWRTVEEVELATLGWVHWHNTQRLHGYLGDLPPVEFEALHATKGELKTPDPGDQSLAGTAPRAAERLPQTGAEVLDSQIAPNAAADALTGPAPAPQPTARPSWPPAPPGSVTIMCGNPGSGINRTRRRPRITDGAVQEPESEQPHG
jgi:hypothetical protein